MKPSLHGIRIPACIMRTTLLSIAGPKVEAGDISFTEATAFEVRSALAELGKTAIEKMAEARPDWIVVDFIDERFDLLLFGNGALAAGSPALLERSNLPKITRFVRVPRAWPAVHEASLQAMASWLDRMLNIVPENRIIIHRALWATTSLRDTSDIKLSKGRVAYIENQNAKLTELYDRLEVLAPRASIIDVPADLRVADPGHRWGPAPYHYVPEYYSAYTAQLKSIIRRPEKARIHQETSLRPVLAPVCPETASDGDPIVRALNCFVQQAFDGDAELAFRLGSAFCQGSLLPERPKLAFELLLRSALLGNGDAVLGVGACLLNGQGVREDRQLGLEWIRLAEACGVHRANRMLGELHGEGRHVPRREDLARIFMRKAAEGGDGQAASRLAWMFEAGIGGEPDPERARYWRRRASGNPDTFRMRQAHLFGNIPT